MISSSNHRRITTKLLKRIKYLFLILLIASIVFTMQHEIQRLVLIIILRVLELLPDWIIGFTDY